MRHTHQPAVLGNPFLLSRPLASIFQCLCIQHLKTIAFDQQLWTLRHLEDVFVEIMRDSDARLPRTMSQGDVQTETAQSTCQRSAGPHLER